MTIRALLCLVSLFLAACHEDANDPAADGGPAPDALSCPAGSRLEDGYAETFGSAGGPIGAVEVCVVGREDLPCRRSRSDGAFALCVPDGEAYAVTATRTGYETSTYFRGPGAPPGVVQVGDDSFVAGIWTSAGASYPPIVVGHLIVMVYDADAVAFVPAAIELDPAEGDVIYGDPFDQRPDPDLGPTGLAYLGDLSPGLYDVRVSAAATPSCVHRDGGGWASDRDGYLLRVPVIEGSTAVVRVTCAP